MRRKSSRGDYLIYTGVRGLDFIPAIYTVG